MSNYDDKKVIICGLGAVGLTYANKFKDSCELFILADKKRINNFEINSPKLNGKDLHFNYITPDKKFDADLIIISTKSNGLNSAIQYINNFVSKKTIIISLINGISSEHSIAEVYGKDKVLHSYFVGHSAVREHHSVTQDGVGKIVFGSPYKENKNKVTWLKNFLNKLNIECEIPDDIIYSMWLKYALNIFSNQASAIMNLTFGDMKNNNNFRTFAKNVVNEVQQIAFKEGVNNTENLETDALNLLNSMVDNGKTSMLQDISAGKETEVEIFAGEIIKLGEKHSIPTPYNKVMYEMIKILEEKSKI